TPEMRVSSEWGEGFVRAATAREWGGAAPLSGGRDSVRGPTSSFRKRFFVPCCNPYSPRRCEKGRLEKYRHGLGCRRVITHEAQPEPEKDPGNAGRPAGGALRPGGRRLCLLLHTPPAELYVEHHGRGNTGDAQCTGAGAARGWSARRHSPGNTRDAGVRRGP